MPGQLGHPGAFFRTAIHEQRAEAAMKYQVVTISLGRAKSEFYTSCIGNADSSNEVFDNAVFAMLGIYPVFEPVDPTAFRVSEAVQFRPGLLEHKVELQPR